MADPTPGFSLGITNTLASLMGVNNDPNRMAVQSQPTHQPTFAQQDAFNQNLATLNAPAPQQQGVSSTGTGGTGGTSPNLNILGQAYDQQIGNFQNQLNQLPVYQDLSSNIIRGDANTQQAGLNSQYATGQANQQLAQHQLDTSHSNSMRDLGDQLRQALSGYQNQIGVQGAGNSSAAGMLSYMLQQQGNKGMNDINTQYNNQQQGLNVAGSALDQQHQQGLQALEQWKNDNLQQIAMQYSQQATQIANSMSGAGTSKAYALQNSNQAAAQGALDQMKALEAQYGNAAQQLQASYQQAQAPTQDIGQYANNFNVNPLSTQQIQATNLSNNQQGTNNGAFNAPVSLQKKDITQPA